MKSFRNILFFFLGFFFCIVFGQERVRVKGQVIIDAKNESAKGIEIINLVTNQKTNTDYYGNFELEVQAEDVIMFSSNDYEERKYTVTPKNIETNKVFIHLNLEINKIDEVVIDNFKVTGDLLSDVRNNQGKLKTYKQQQIVAKVKPGDLSTGEVTPEYTGDHRAGIGFGDKKNRQRRKALAEKGELDIQNRIQLYFEDDFYTDILNIPSDEIGNFVAYCYLSSEVKKLAELNKFSKIRVKMMELAPRFLKRLQKIKRTNYFNDENKKTTHLS